MAVDLFSFGSMDGRVKADFAGLGLENTQRVRDLWQQREMGVFMSAFESAVPSHGVVLVRLTAKQKSGRSPRRSRGPFSD